MATQKAKYEQILAVRQPNTEVFTEVQAINDGSTVQITAEQWEALGRPAQVTITIET